VRAYAYQSLDWCAIQLAAWHVKRSPLEPPPPAELNRVLGDKELFDGPNQPHVEVAIDENGSFVFPSPITSPFRENNTVFGRFFLTGDDWRNHPTAILLHGWNASWCYRYTMPPLARRLARAKVNAAMFELPYHMQRRPGRPRGVDFLSSDLEATLGAARQALADTRVLLTWLLDQGVPGVGLWGFSLGAWLAGLMARFDPRLRFLVLTTPIARIDRLIEDLPFCDPLRRSLRQVELDLNWLNLFSQCPRMDPSNILLMASQYDLFVPPETVEELWQAWAGAEIWRLPHGHISVMASPSALLRALNWIARKAAGG
jgi:pimeloyl-ACP methyl ester carboxylesterase